MLMTAARSSTSHRRRFNHQINPARYRDIPARNLRQVPYVYPSAAAAVGPSPSGDRRPETNPDYHIALGAGVLADPHPPPLPPRRLRRGPYPRRRAAPVPLTAPQRWPAPEPAARHARTDPSATVAQAEETAVPDGSDASVLVPVLAEPLRQGCQARAICRGRGGPAV